MFLPWRTPETGFDIYDSYDCGPKCEEFIQTGGWATIGGTSVAAPLISGMYAPQAERTGSRIRR